MLTPRVALVNAKSLTKIRCLFIMELQMQGPILRLFSQIHLDRKNPCNPPAYKINYFNDTNINRRQFENNGPFCRTKKY